MSNRLLTEILRPKKLEQLILPPRIRKAIGDGTLKQNFLFYGSPGTGKCFHPDTTVTIRNIKTGEISTVSAIDIYEKFKPIPYNQKTNNSNDI